MDLEERIDRFQEVFTTDPDFVMPTDEGEEIQIISDSLISQSEVAILLNVLYHHLLAFHNRHASYWKKRLNLKKKKDEDKLNIFTKVALDDAVKAIVGAAQFNKFSEPLIQKKFCER